MVEMEVNIMEKKKVDLNSDIGEGFGKYRVCDDEKVLSLITSANIACGFHAGDPNIMRQVTKLCKKYNVGIGAHPGFPDLLGFGRRYMNIEKEELENYLYYQLGALEGFANLVNEKIQHCTPHGAWGNWLEKDLDNAKKFIDMLSKYNRNIIVLAISGGYRTQIAKNVGLKVAHDFFADREIDDNGLLVSRSISGSVLYDKNKIVKRLLKAVLEEKVNSFDGKEINIKVDSICVHGDTEGSLEIIRAIRSALLKEDVVITKLSDFV